ncbi:hypothetical protein GCK72_007320 [Caenorhabditis remanei]|uniref:Uncharacterized protein n=1 Tax=Caenorhabditis remanei TaxID=31234 RepID=A0A6A5HJS4_CAERE|nr:hypothetical protein GCK72_007319 [Caenorhabditis remanei]XP_053590302.1 hypothetical protein GCK72_007320 [Caenorhabditis remanei]KAF1767360.1 hypothetical protein GCK72_007319 [Caenorhabditis remanei]KAF1767361.1 hypothetical protein GCK72_007320 [Caenorhabditis remanei]
MSDTSFNIPTTPGKYPPNESFDYGFGEFEPERTSTPIDESHSENHADIEINHTAEEVHDVGGVEKERIDENEEVQIDDDRKEEVTDEEKEEDVADKTEKDGDRKSAKKRRGENDRGAVVKRSKTIAEALDAVEKQKEAESEEFLQLLDFGEQAEAETVNRKISLHHFLKMELQGQLLRQVSQQKITDMASKIYSSIGGVKALFDIDLINSRPHVLVSADGDDEHPVQGVKSDGNHRAIAVLTCSEHLLKQADIDVDNVFVKINPSNFANLFQLSRSLKPDG